MKIKNVVVGGYIQSKKDSKQLIAGHCYQVADKDISDKTVKLVSIDNSFDDSLWFCVSDFRKPRPQPQTEPKLKQLDQSVFNGLDEKWRFAAVDKGGEVWVYSGKPDRDCGYWFVKEPVGMSIGKGYDASNWQNSLIERDIAKELLEVDLSGELTGSELCKAMLARGDKYVMCGVSDVSDLDAASNEYDDLISDAVTDFDNKDGLFGTASMRWIYAVPINNQGEPLTAAEAGL